jgi:phage shock protein E
MINTIKKIFGLRPPLNYIELLKQGATILDVRSPGEYEGGHIKGSINIPLDKDRDGLAKLKDNHKPIITCCASGMRSASAKNLLISNGFTEVHNGGGWSILKSKIQ